MLSTSHVNEAEALKPLQFYECWEQLERFAKQYCSQESLEQIANAYRVASRAHSGQWRINGAPYLTHVVAVSCLLAERQLEPEVLIAGLLHDTLEDTALSEADLTAQFGPVVTKLVKGVSKLNQLKVTFGVQKTQALHFQQVLMASAKDPRILLIKLADRTHNALTLKGLPRKKLERIAQETLDLYAPLASRLGLRAFQVAMEESAFSALYPWRDAILRAQLQKSLMQQRPLIARLKKEIFKILTEQHHVPAAIYTRQKQVYPLYKKLKAKSCSIRELRDMIAVRVIVPKITDCYLALGVLHTRYLPKPGSFKDYVALPKRNGYQSLHTVLAGPLGQPLEVQIRTQEMDAASQPTGFCPHWQYKANIQTRYWAQSADRSATSSATAILEATKLDLQLENIYVLTPGGKIVVLPEGSTAVDLAYAIHSKLGSTCVGAEVNHRPYPLSQPLKTLQLVSIVTSNTATPSVTWLNFVVTPKAQMNIRSWLRQLPEAAAIRAGQRFLELTLNQPLSRFSPEILKHTSLALDCSDNAILFKKLGCGEIPPVAVVQILQQLSEPEDLSGKPGSEKNQCHSLGYSGYETRVLAHCCYPLPGDRVFGVVTHSKGLVVHRQDCPNLKNHKYRLGTCIELQWGGKLPRLVQFNLLIELSAPPAAFLTTLASDIQRCGGIIYQATLHGQLGCAKGIRFFLAMRPDTSPHTLIKLLKRYPEVTQVHRL